MEEYKNAARPQRANSDKAEVIAAAQRLSLSSNRESNGPDAAILESAFPKGYIVMADEDPSASMGLPGKWMEKTKVWIRTE